MRFDGGAVVIVLAEDEVAADQLGYVVDGVCRPDQGAVNEPVEQVDGIHSFRRTKGGPAVVPCRSHG
jgi:hypothetical protein